MAELIDQDALRRRLAAAWEAGFHAGQCYGQATERHDPQWDMDPAPERPENPYLWKESRHG
jgi:hypothetical protein